MAEGGGEGRGGREGVEGGVCKERERERAVSFAWHCSCAVGSSAEWVSVVALMRDVVLDSVLTSQSVRLQKHAEHFCLLSAHLLSLRRAAPLHWHDRGVGWPVIAASV